MIHLMLQIQSINSAVQSSARFRVRPWQISQHKMLYGMLTTISIIQNRQMLNNYSISAKIKPTMLPLYHSAMPDKHSLVTKAKAK